VPFFYHRSGERVRKGDLVRLHREPGEVEFVADPLDDTKNCYVKEFGGGVMILEPKCFGRLLIPFPVSDYDDLEFVSRGPE
jgi:hypothetical protein